MNRLDAGSLGILNQRPAESRVFASRRGAADEARGDQLATALIGLGTAVLSIAVAALGRGTVAAQFVALVTLCVTPGCALVCWLQTRERQSRVLAVLAVSLTWSILITTVLALLQVTDLRVLVLLTAGLGGVESAIFLVAERAWNWNSALDRAREEESDDQSTPRPTAPESAPGSRVPVVIGFIALLAGAGLLAEVVVRARGHAVGSYGLLPLLGAPFIAAVALTIGVLALSLWFVRTAWPVAALALGLLIIELNGTPMMLAVTPFGNLSTYEHFGVVDYIIHGGALNDPLDVYQQWPGFFAIAAGFERLSGSSSLTYSSWAQLLFESLDALVVFAIARRFSAAHQAVPYVAVLLFETASWEGQFYYSPQAIAFTLMLFFMYFLLPMMDPDRLRRPFSRLPWLKELPSGIFRGAIINEKHARLRIVGLIAIFVAITVAHQLSPYFIFAGVAVLWILGVLRNSLIVAALVIAILGYPLLHVAALDHNNWLSGFSLANATSGYSQVNIGGPVKLASKIARLIGLGFWAITAICALSYRRRFGIVFVPVVLAAIPFSLIAAGNYGGEAINRIFLFSAPWCAIVIAMRLGELGRVPLLRWAAVGLWSLFAGLGSAQAQDFGLFATNQPTPGEIQASEYFLDNAPVNAGLVLAVADFPARINGGYVLHDPTQTVNDPLASQVASCDAPVGEALSSITPPWCRVRTDPRALAQSVSFLGRGDGFLVFSPSMVDFAQYGGAVAPGSLQALLPRLEASPYWRLWYDRDGVEILKALPQGQG